jgi:peptidoglycan/LPS O-acetylase OafA/YrhL
MAVRPTATHPKPAFTTAPTPHSLAGFDGLRAIAALLIICHHTGFVSGTTFHTRWGYYFTRMDIGVPVFFAISAFLLTRPFAAALLDNQPLPDRHRFWVRRLARIFPAYIVATIIILIGHGINVRGASGLFFSLSLTHIYHPGRFISGITQSWSLATELSFYLLLPLWAMFMRRRLAGRGVNRGALVLLGSIAVLFVSSFIFRLGFHAVLPNRWFLITRYWLPSLIDLFAPGMALAVISVWAQRRSFVADATQIGQHALACWAAALVVFWFVSTQLGLEKGLVVSSFSREMFRQTLYAVVGLLLVAPVALRGRRPSRILSVLDLPPIAGFGVVSYGVYLWHQYVLREVGSFMGWPLFSDHFWGLLLPTVAISALVGWVSWRVVERPALALTSGWR